MKNAAAIKKVEAFAKVRQIDLIRYQAEFGQYVLSWIRDERGNASVIKVSDSRDPDRAEFDHFTTVYYPNIVKALRSCLQDSHRKIFKHKNISVVIEILFEGAALLKVAKCNMTAAIKRKDGSGCYDFASFFYVSSAPEDIASTEHMIEEDLSFEEILKIANVIAKASGNDHFEGVESKIEG